MLGALTDLRHRRIPNWLTGPVFVSGLAWSGAHSGVVGVADGFGGGLVLATPYLVLYAFFHGGAGDAKLTGALGAWSGFALSLTLLLCISLAGMVVACLYLCHVRWRQHQPSRKPSPGPRAKIMQSKTGGRRQMPYAPSIFLGVCLWITGLQLWTP
jgi:Flp pilus assembly protein protease CpaA